MTELLRYRYVAGEHRPFRLELSLIVEGPEREPVTDTAILHGTLQIEEVADDESATIVVNTVPLEQVKLGPLLPEERGRYRLNRRGLLLSAEPGAPAVPFIVFPHGPIEPKKLWNTMDKLLGRNLFMAHTMGFVETHRGQRCAHVVTEGSARGNPRIEFTAVRLFAIDAGRLLDQRAVTKYIWDTGFTTSLLVDQSFEDASPHESGEECLP